MNHTLTKLLQAQMRKGAGMNLKKISALFTDALVSGCTPQRLSRSWCVGLYIAFSPFPGLHTVMMFACKYLFDLHFPTLFIATSINNPWTMAPFYYFDYECGYWIIHSLLGLNPSWVISLAKIFGTGKICIWSFFIGGNVLGICSAFIGYPITTYLFSRLASRIASK
jgi:uncharacterized protein (DUF2062 family)